MLHTPIRDLLGIELPISDAGMGVALASLAAAVSEAGGIGTVALADFSPEAMIAEISAARAHQEGARSDWSPSCATALSSSWRINPSMR